MTTIITKGEVESVLTMEMDEESCNDPVGIADGDVHRPNSALGDADDNDDSDVAEEKNPDGLDEGGTALL